MERNPQPPDARADGRCPPGEGPEISVIIPVLNEEANIPKLRDSLVESMESLGRTWEAVVVNDGSTDRSGELLDLVAEADPRFTVVHFRRNFGQTAAFSAALRYARGSIIVPMDGDLQNDPRDIPKLLAKMSEGFEVVSGWRRDRRDPVSKRLPSRIANPLISLLTGVRLHDYGCSLKAYERGVIEDISLYGEMHRFMPAYAAVRGARVAEIPVSHHPRTAGKSKYGLERTIKVVLDLVVVKFFLSFMNKPMYMFGGLGMAALAAGFFCLAAGVTLRLLPPQHPWHLEQNLFNAPLTLLGVVFAAAGVVMILQGVLAELVMRTYYESQGKDPYAILRVSAARPGHPEHVTPEARACGAEKRGRPAATIPRQDS